MYSRGTCKTAVSRRSGRLGGVVMVVAILRLAGKVLALAPDDALDEPLGRHQRYVLRPRPLLQRRRAGVVRHHHVVPAGGGKLWGGGRARGRDQLGGGGVGECLRPAGFQSAKRVYSFLAGRRSCIRKRRQKNSAVGSVVTSSPSWGCDSSSIHEHKKKKGLKILHVNTSRRF